MSSEQNSDRGTASSGRGSARHRRLLGGLTLALLASWLLTLAPLPFSLFAGVAGLAALVLLILLVVQSFREGRRGMAIMAAVIGVPATLMIITGSLLSLLFYGPMAEIQECRATAITEQAQSQCDVEAQDSMAEWLSGLLGG
ncbi:hypothetical protein ACFQS2_06290 [Brachybacterium sp. GCM10030267]|uniref:hypothetical protein n=1 Tax=Brachybacterium sp. GCM10030267 TaxID=3273381 RepID=UPI00361987D7